MAGHSTSSYIMMAAASDSESSAYSDASLEALRKEFVEIKVLLEEYEDPRDGLEALRTKLASAEMWGAAEVHYVLTRALGKAVGWVMGKTYSDALFEAEVVPILKVALSLAVEHARTTHEVWSVLTLVFDSAHQCYINDNVGAAVDIDDMEFENEAAFQTKDGRFAAMPKDEFGITRVEYVELLNYFGELGGFDVLYELAGDESLTARDLYGLFHSLNLLRNFLTQECVERTVEQLYASVAARIDGLTEETIRALDPPSLQSAFRQLRGFAMSSLGSAAARRAERKYIKALQARGREAAEAEAAAVPTSTHRHYARDIEHLMLTLSLKYLRSATLPKQVHGANEIKSFILSAEKRDDDLYRLEYGLPASTAKKDGIGKFKSLFTFTEFMLQWLTENEVLELMLRPEAHTEVVKRSETVLRFLSHHERLETRFIDLLWNYSVDKHESDVAVVYDVILAMSQSLSADHCEYIFCKLMELKPEHVAKPQLRLIHYYAANLLQRYQSAALTESDPFHHSALATNCPTLASQHFGVALLWRLAQDGSGVRAEFREQVIQSIQVLLQPRLGEFYRTTYLGNCITAIKQGASVATSLRLLQMILQSFPEPGTVEPPVLDRSQFIEELQQSEQILQLVVHAIELYKREAGPSPPSEANTTEIAARLDVLKFLLENNAKLSLAPADIDTLWALLVEQAADDAERDATFDWLATCCPPCPPISAYTNASNGDAASGGGDDADGEPACLSRESAEYIFVHKLGSMPRQSFSPSALQCMIKYFKYVNAINNVMIVANPKTTPATEFIVLRSAEFHGVKPLWELGIWAESPQVREQVSVFLNSLYSKSVRNDPMVAKHHFLVTAMAYLRDGFTASQQSKQQLHAMQQQGHTVEPAHVEHTQHAAALVERAFTLLESFLEACEGTLAKGDIFESAADEAADNPANKTITVKVHVANGKRFRLQLRPSTTCKRLFNAVARQMDIPPEILRLMSQGITITNTATRSIADLGISDGAKITAVKQVGPASTKALKTYLVKKRKGLLTWDDGDGGASGAPSAAELQQRPSWIISQTPDYFDLMFELLCDTNLMARVWRLICHMPVNKQFEHQMKTLNTAPAPAQGQPAPERVTDWDVLLNMHNQFRLLYGLKIIDGILFPSDSLMHNSREQLQWIGQFVSYGGFGHLTHLLVTFINHMNPAYGPADANRAMERREFNRDLLSYISVGRRALHIALKVFVAFAYNMLKSKNAFVLSLAPPIKPVPATFTINNFDHYFTVVDYPVLVAKLVSVVHEVASTPLPPARRSSDSQASVVVVDSGASSGSVASDGEIVELGSFLAVALLLTGEQEGHHVDVSQLESPTWEQFVQSLVFSLDSKVRAASTDAIFNLAAKGPLHDGGAFERALSQFGASESAPLIGSTLSVLLANMDTVLANPGFRYRSEEYFALLCRCLVFLYSPVAESEHDVGALQQLYVRTWSALDALPSGEVNTKSPVDQLVCGLLSMLRTLFKLCPSLKDEARERGVLDYIYHTCLFDTPTFANTQAAVASQLAVKSGGSEVDAMTLASPPQLPPKCRTSRSRETAFDVILELTADHESNWRFIADKLASAYADAEAPRSWEYDPDDLQRGETGYSGLKNLGCICYMNASVQQLFMIEDFRSKLLAVRPQYAASKGAQDTADRRTTLEDELVEDPMREGDVVHGVPEPEEDEDGHSDSEDGEEAGGGDDEAEEVDPRDDDYFYQLQRIFANLARSDRPFFNPYSFCMSYKDYDGQPVDVSEQMDANEFLNQLFDKIEESLKPYPEAASLIRDTFMGKQVYQTICQECGYVSEREEPFYTLIAEVKNKPTLTESLASYCAGELLTGSNRYNCSGCEKKVNALRRTCIKSLPENLIICLKRFEFNYDIMQKFKINAECRFPTTLNMKPYTTAGLEQAEGGGDKGGDDGNGNDDDSCVFELTGIVVHTGIAEAGHYYSYIKEATSSQWFEFNDEDVSPFNPDRIPQQCYGGSEVRQVYDLKLKKKVYKTVDRPNNAYVLVYRRVRRSEGKVDGDGGDGGDGSDGGNNSSALVPAVAAMGPEQLYQLRMQRLQQVPLGDDISKSIWLENTDIARNCRLFDPSYFRFMHKLFQQQEQGPSSSSSLYPYAHREGTAHSFDTPHIQALQLSYNFIVKTLAHAFDKSQLEPWLDSIVAALERDLSACIQLLQHMIDDNSWLINMLLQCGAADTRKGFVRIVMTAVRQLVPYERPYYRANKPFSWAKKRLQQEDDAAAAAPAPAGDEDTATQTTEEGARHLRVAPARSVLVDFVEEVILLLTKASPFWRTFPQYFELLLEFARLGPQERQVLLDRHLVSECIAFVEGTTSPYLSSFVEVELHEKMGTKMTPPKLAPMVELILLLVRGCHTRDPSAPPPSTLPGAVLELDKHDKKRLLNPTFINKMLKSNVSPSDLASVYAHWAWNNPPVSDTVMEVVIDGIDKYDEEAYPPFFCMMLRMFDLRDGLQSSRVETYMPRLLNTIYANSEYADATFACIQFLVRLSSNNALCKRWMLHPAHRPDWAWIEQYVSSKPGLL